MWVRVPPPAPVSTRKNHPEYGFPSKLPSDSEGEGYRPGGIAECDTILIMEGGMAKAFGPRDEVLKANVRNYAQVAGRICGQEAQA